MGYHPLYVITGLQCEGWMRVYCREEKGQGPFQVKTRHQADQSEGPEPEELLEASVATAQSGRGGTPEEG